MSFQPLRLLVLYDDAWGLCRRVVPTMMELLENRAFEIDVRTTAQELPGIDPYAGLILGTPVRGLGVRAPTPSIAAAISGMDLEDRKVALFCVTPFRVGRTFDRMKGLCLDQGAEVVCARSYNLFRPHLKEHELPTECMVRIR